MKMLGIDISLTGFESAAAVMRANKIQSKAKVNRGRAALEQLLTFARKYRGPKFSFRVIGKGKKFCFRGQ